MLDKLREMYEYVNTLNLKEIDDSLSKIENEEERLFVLAIENYLFEIRQRKYIKEEEQLYKKDR